jgi:hypothetical protein
MVLMVQCLAPVSPTQRRFLSLRSLDHGPPASTTGLPFCLVRTIATRVQDVDDELGAIGASTFGVLDLTGDTPTMLIVSDFQTVPVLHCRLSLRESCAITLPSRSERRLCFSRDP